MMWLNLIGELDCLFKYVFLLGEFFKGFVNDMIVEENECYYDII